MIYATSVIQPYRSMQDNLRIWVFATKHNLTIAEVEEKL